jgi:cyclic pyranopterin phosphate synthase
MKRSVKPIPGEPSAVVPGASPAAPASAASAASRAAKARTSRASRQPRSLTHVDATGRPAMVDVSAKLASVREARAECRVRFPPSIAAQLRASGLKSAKGGIVDTAIIAGTMAVKRTHELIPFCHPLPIDACRLAIDWAGDTTLRIECVVKTTHRTGVEMEALTGATVAALTVYDMCKALSPRIVIGPAKVLGKRGGKHDFGALA